MLAGVYVLNKIKKNEEEQNGSDKSPFVKFILYKFAGLSNCFFLPWRKTLTLWTNPVNSLFEFIINHALLSIQLHVFISVLDY